MAAGWRNAHRLTRSGGDLVPTADVLREMLVSLDPESYLHGFRACERQLRESVLKRIDMPWQRLPTPQRCEQIRRRIDRLDDADVAHLAFALVQSVAIQLWIDADRLTDDTGCTQAAAVDTACDSLSATHPDWAVQMMILHELLDSYEVRPEDDWLETDRTLFRQLVASSRPVPDALAGLTDDVHPPVASQPGNAGAEADHAAELVAAVELIDEAKARLAAGRFPDVASLERILGASHAFRQAVEAREIDGDPTVDEFVATLQNPA